MNANALASLIAGLDRPLAADFSAIEPVACPCGQAKRGLIDERNGLCSIHEVTISENSKTHYHKEHAEVYYALEGRGQLEIEGRIRPFEPGQAILIPPRVRHRPVVEEGEKLKILNFVIPPFDPEDERFD